MSFKTVTKSTQYYEDATHGSFELPFTGEFYREQLHVTPDGLHAVLGMLCTDDDPQDPFDGDEGEFYQFDPRNIHYCERPEIDKFKRIVRENPGRVVTHNGTGDWHGPGTTRCLVKAGPFTVADTKNPKTRGEYSAAENALYDAQGYYIVPEDATDPAKYAQGTLETYSAFCNGEVYGVLAWIYERETTDDEWTDPDRERECWGFTPAEYAEQELQEQFDAAVKELSDQAAA